MNTLRSLLLLALFVPAFHASAADSEEERIAAARRYLEVAQMSKITDDTVTDLQVVGADAVAFIGYSSYTYPTGTHRIYVVHASVLSSAPASP